MNIGNRRRKKELQRELAELRAAHERDHGELLWYRAVSNSDNSDLIVIGLETKMAEYERRMAEIGAELENPAAPRPALTAPEPAGPPAALGAACENPLAVRLLEVTIASRLRFSELPSDLDYQVAGALDQIAPVLNGGSFPVALLRLVKRFEREAASRQPPPEFFEELRGLPNELLAMARQYTRSDSP